MEVLLPDDLPPPSMAELLESYSADRLGQSLDSTADICLPLLLRPERWIHRRVERIRIIDRRTIHRTVSADFTLPPGTPPIEARGEEELRAAPLYLLRRDHPDPLREGKPRGRLTPWRKQEHPRRLPMSLFADLTFADDHGHHLPLITRRQCTALASLMLGKLAAQTIGEPLPEELSRQVATIVQGNRRNRRDALLNVFDKGAEGPRERLRESAEFGEFACVLATHLPIVCLLPGKARRMVTKLSYVEPIDPDESMSKAQLRRFLFLKSEYFAVSITEIAASASHHIEVTLPDDLQLNYIALTGKEYRSANVPWKKLKARERVCSIRQVDRASRGNLYMSDMPPGRRMGRVALKLRVCRTGFMLGALATSLAITVLLTVMALLAHDVFRDSDSEAAVVTLLILPTIVAAYVARPGEHSITSRMLRFPRAVLLFNASLLLFAVVADLTTPRGHPKADSPRLGGFLESICHLFDSRSSPWHVLQGRWAALAALSAVCTAIFVLTNFWPRPHGKSRHWPKPVEASAPAAS